MHTGTRKYNIVIGT